MSDLLEDATSAQPASTPRNSSPPQGRDLAPAGGTAHVTGTSAHEKSRWPTHKWWAALFTATGAWVANFITAGTFNKAIAIALVGLISQSLVAWVTPNDGSIGGVKPRTTKSRARASAGTP